MLNPQPVQFRWQKLAIAPIVLLLLAVLGAGVLWFQRADSAGAVPTEYYRVYEGSATVKVKNGNAWGTYPVNTCTVVETNGPDGDIKDVFIFGVNANETNGDSDSGQVPCGKIVFIGNGDDPSVALEGYVEPQMLPGTFIIVTYVDEALTGGSGWKTNPLKLTSTSWRFTMKKPENWAGAIALNNDFRLLQGNTTLLVKFIRNRQGLYWKVAGMAPLNDNGFPKVNVEIESPGLGHDAPPQFASSDPDQNSSETVDSDSSQTIQFSEPVNIDPTGVSYFCGGDAQAFTILGQGTSTITIDPVNNLPAGASCYILIIREAITDVDTIDPPDRATAAVLLFFQVANSPFPF